MYQWHTKSGAKLFQRLGVRLGLADDRDSSPGVHVVATQSAVAPPQEISIAPQPKASAAAAGGSSSRGPDPSTLLSELLQATPNTSLHEDALNGLLRIMDEPSGGRRKRIREVRDLAMLSSGVEASETSELPVPKPRRTRKVPVYETLARKTIALVGWDTAGQEEIERALSGQKCQCRTVPFDPLEPQATSEPADCDLVIFAAPSNWELIEPIHAGFLTQTRKPILVAGSPRLLLRLAQVPQPGIRDYVAQPLAAGELALRAALLLSHPAVPPTAVAAKVRREKAEILIADDDPTTRTLLGTLLARQGMICHLAENGAEALEIFKSKKPCAAVMDIIMPSMDGFQILAAVKQDPDLQNIPVLLLTSRNAEVDKLQAFALGADDYLVKPFSPMELAVRLKRLLKQAT